MKIDFAAPFKDVARVLEQAQVASRCTRKGEKVGLEFSRLLGQLLQSSKRSLESEQTASTIAAEKPASLAEKGPMARAEFPTPELEAPSVVRLSPTSKAIEQPSSVLEPPQAPQVVSAKRVDASNSLHVLDKPQREQVVAKLVKSVSRSIGVDPALALAVIDSESSFNPRAISSDGHASKGLFQLLDSTGKELLNEHTLNVTYNPFDPELNVDLGVRYLRRLHDTFAASTRLSNGYSTIGAANSADLEKLAVAAFNAGEGRVAHAQNTAREAGKDPSSFNDVKRYLPEITQEYVERVMASRGRFEASSIG